MKLKVTKENVWAATIKDRPGSLADKMDALAAVGVNLEFIIARRQDTKKGIGVVYVTPIKGPKREQAAKKVGFHKTRSLHSLRVEAADKPGLGAAVSRAVADAGINLRGFSGAALGRKCILHLAFDKATDADKAARILKKM